MTEPSDEVLLSNIIPQCTYCDEKSIENRKPTPHPTRKYKLAGGEILDQYFFHVLTRRAGACRSGVTLIINPDHWDNKIAGPYLDQISHCDLRKYELLTRKNLLDKIKDRENRFIYIAKLCHLKCIELLELNTQLQKDYSVSREIKEIVNTILSDIIPDEIMLKLGI